LRTFGATGKSVGRPVPGLICTSIVAPDVSNMERLGERALAEGSDLIEFRLDSLDDRDARRIAEGLSSFAGHCIVTAKPEDQGGSLSVGEEESLKLLMDVGEMKPAYVDVELAAALRHPTLVGELRKRCRQLIVSWHDLAGTPSVGELKKTALVALKAGDLSKVVTTASGISDNATILSLHREVPRGKLVAFCMGEEGRISRVLCLLAGSPFTYACLDGRAAAPGQIPLRYLREMLDSFG
jgi:3-dehydroquinate dehydratase-1